MLDELIVLLGTPQIQWIVTLIGVDVVLGIIAALKAKSFRLGKVSKFMGTPVLGYVFGLAILEIVAQSIPSLAIFVQVAYILVILGLAGSILNNLGKLGVPIPTILKKD